MGSAWARGGGRRPAEGRQWAQGGQSGAHAVAAGGRRQKWSCGHGVCTTKVGQTRAVRFGWRARGLTPDFGSPGGMGMMVIGEEDLGKVRLIEEIVIRSSVWARVELGMRVCDPELSSRK